MFNLFCKKIKRIVIQSIVDFFFANIIPISSSEVVILFIAGTTRKYHFKI